MVKDKFYSTDLAKTKAELEKKTSCPLPLPKKEGKIKTGERNTRSKQSPPFFFFQSSCSVFKGFAIICLLLIFKHQLKRSSISEKVIIP